MGETRSHVSAGKHTSPGAESTHSPSFICPWYIVPDGKKNLASPSALLMSPSHQEPVLHPSISGEVCNVQQGFFAAPDGRL